MYLDSPRHTVQLYQGDDVCIDGSKRKTIVMYKCGKENHVIQFRVGLRMSYDIQEYGMCNYELQFETPLVCKQKDVDTLKSTIQSLIQDNHYRFDRNEYTMNFE